MLVIGYQSEENFVFSRDLDIDVDVDSPRKIHDLLKKEANGTDFSSIVIVDDSPAVVATYSDTEDYDLTEPPELDDDEDDEDADPDSLHEEDDDEDDDDE